MKVEAPMMTKRRASTVVTLVLASCLVAASCEPDDGTTTSKKKWEHVFSDLPGALLGVWGSSASDVFTVGSEVIRLIIGLPLAFALNRSFKGKRLVQGLILIPFVIPIALSALAWKWMFDSLYSVINWMLMRVHLIDYPWQWLGEPGLAMWSVIIMNVWRGFPFSAVILLAGLTAVPQEVIEAAKIDGAGPLRRFHYVVVPIVRPILLVGLLYSVVFSFTDFSAVWLLTQGGPYNTTHVFGTYAYNIGINAGDLGMGAAITLFIFPFLALIVILMLRFLRRE